jgi:hypothetical protein
MLDSTLSEHLLQIINHFKISGEIAEIMPYGSGHINDTYLLKNASLANPDYILQRVNHTIFKDVPRLTTNILLVTNHIRTTLEQAGLTDIDNKVLTLIGANNGKYYFKDQDGNFWRIYLFIANAKCYDIVKTSTQAFEGGVAYGRFQEMLSTFDASLLHDTIPDFHHLGSRLSQLAEAVSANPKNRVAEVEDLLEFVGERTEAMHKILRMGDAGDLPLRITHNDTKFNNVLLDQQDNALCVVDLDTVMQGYIAYDFGDAVRSIINTAAEDEADLTLIQLNLALYEAFTKGFLMETADSLTFNEINTLIDGVLLLPYLMGVRFLTDYLNGDVYYKIYSEKHNLQRARSQFQLIRKLEENYNTLNEIINSHSNSLSRIKIETNAAN